MSYSDEILAACKADEELMARPVDERITLLAGMDIMVMKPRYGHDPRFNIQWGVDTSAYEWIVGEAFYRSSANLSREQTARRLFSSIVSRDAAYPALDQALVARHYALEAGTAA